MKQKDTGGEIGGEVRLDKWLWAARFFKTRALAHAAIEAGRVFVDELQAKPGRKVRIGQLLLIRTSAGEYSITINKIAAQRASPSIASTFYSEDSESKSRREKAAALRQASRIDAPSERPNTQDRQRLRRLKQGEW